VESASSENVAQTDDIPVFGARKKAKQLAAEVATLRAELERLGAMSVIELEQRREALEQEVAGHAAQLEAEQLAAAEALERQAVEAKADLETEIAAATEEVGKLDLRLLELRQDVVVTEEEALLQEAGVYEYQHPLEDSVEYQDALKALKAQVRAMTKKDGGAVVGNTNWTVNGSLPQGRKMVRDFSKLMLRAYNAEADNLVRGLKPYKLDAAIEKLTKVVATIARLGQTMGIHISGPYHELREYELKLTADYRQKQAEEKEREREEKERLREEKAAQKEMEKERARLEKEQQHYLNTLETLKAKGDAEAVARHEAELEKIARAIEDVDYRAANIRAGYVYVISNVGSFGEGVVKVGLTRRLEPQDRVRELGDASVPFRFDVHALLFSEDAVGIESQLHERLAERRVNRINLRREFFRATPAEVKEHLLAVAGELLTFEEGAEALEYRQSLNMSEGAVE
jgi:DNA repair exonuclease SbcCD ATPase subunit